MRYQASLKMINRVWRQQSSSHKLPALPCPALHISSKLNLLLEELLPFPLAQDGSCSHDYLALSLTFFHLYFLTLHGYLRFCLQGYTSSLNLIILYLILLYTQFCSSPFLLPKLSSAYSIYYLPPFLTAYSLML